jgi:hypothetical protein
MTSEFEYLGEFDLIFENNPSSVSGDQEHALDEKKTEVKNLVQVDLQKLNRSKYRKNVTQYSIHKIIRIRHLYVTFVPPQKKGFCDMIKKRPHSF